MENINNKEPMQITGKQIEKFFLMILATLVGYMITTYFIIPGVSFMKFFLTELTMTGLALISSKLSGPGR